MTTTTIPRPRIKKEARWMRAEQREAKIREGGQNWSGRKYETREYLIHWSPGEDLIFWISSGMAGSNDVKSTRRWLYRAALFYGYASPPPHPFYAPVLFLTRDDHPPFSSSHPSWNWRERSCVEESGKSAVGFAQIVQVTPFFSLTSSSLARAQLY